MNLADYDLWRIQTMMEISADYTKALFNNTPIPLLHGDVEYIYRGKYIEFVVMNGVRTVQATVIAGPSDIRGEMP